MHRLRVFHWALLCAAGAFVFTGCDLFGYLDDGRARPQLLPLKVGNQWIMQYTSTDTTGRVLASRIDTFAVVGRNMIGGQEWFSIRMLGWKINSSCFSDGLYAEREGGLWRYDRTEKTPKLLYRYPAAPGETYELEPGRAVRFVGAREPFELPGQGMIRSKRYQEVISRVESLGYVFEGEMVLEMRFSERYGLVQLQGYLLYGELDKRLVPSELEEWKLLEFVEADD